MNIYSKIGLVMDGLVVLFALYAAIFLLRSRSLIRKLSQEERNLYRKILSENYLDRSWKCVSVTEDDSGPFGTMLRRVLIESCGERIYLCSWDSQIVEGVEVQLRFRTDKEEKEKSVWVSFVDKYAIPVVVLLDQKPVPVG